MEFIEKLLIENQDPQYKDFQSALLPTLDKESVLGVRVPILRRLSKSIDKDIYRQFIKELPHKYYDENNLHAFLIENIKDIDECYSELERFLPYVDNWATCDMMSPKAIINDKERLLKSAEGWIDSEPVYVKRYGIGVLMKYFLDDDFKPEYIEKISCIRSEEYYVNMMIAWYFATALAKQYEATVPYLEAKKLSQWVHNKAIVKACESYRVSSDHKAYLKTLKW